ncbi:DUF2474 domain-containing protein [Legionella dresdenensis]|uniref:DUF2474 domain-containing protein n=1 Tax=Legionella dresdenensis TaxID=450200 RepID=A0ABV8CD14_9GAMM
MKTPLWKRWGWLIIIWTSSVCVLALAALFFRCLMTWAGFKS